MKRSLLATAALTAVLAAPQVAAAETYKIAVLQSLTGPAAFIGTEVADGMVMAAEEINESGYLGEGNMLDVVVADDATDRTQTLSLVTRYANDPEMLAVLGPTSGAVALAGANVGNELEIPVMTTTNSMEVQDNGPWSFILTQPAFVTIPFLSDYAIEEIGVESCAVVGINDVEAYVTLQRTMEEMLQEGGVEIASQDGVSVTTSDFSAIATRLATSDQDCVFISAPAPQGANIVIQLRQAGLDPDTAILGHNAFASPQFVERGGAAVEGVYLIGDWVPGGFDEYSAAFAERYEAKHGAPPDNWSAVGFGGMYVLADAIKLAQPDVTRESLREAMENVEDVRVVVGQGIYNRDDEGVPRVGMNVLQVQDGEFVKVN